MIGVDFTTTVLTGVAGDGVVVGTATLAGAAVLVEAEADVKDRENRVYK